MRESEDLPGNKLCSSWTMEQSFSLISRVKRDIPESVVYRFGFFFEGTIIMYFYWRIMEELKYLGEQLVFQHPNFKREFTQWSRRNRSGLALAAVEKRQQVLNDYDPFGIKLSLN